MNIGFAAVVVILFLTPGILAREAYFSGQFSRRYFASRSMQEFAVVIFASLLMHLFFTTLIPAYENLVTHELLDCVANGNYAGVEDHCRERKSALIHYWIFTNTWALWIGYTLQKTIRYFKLDRLMPVFRFPNTWHYLLTGEIKEFSPRGYTLREAKKDAVLVDLLVDLSGVSYLYTGLLDHYRLNSEAGLDSLILRDVFRIKRDDYDRHGHSMAHIMAVDGERMLFDRAQILNYNVSYITINTSKKYPLLQRLWRYIRVSLITGILLLIASKQSSIAVALIVSLLTVF
ncbi:MAG: hypothetical protein H6591_09705 [Flavobacteriales bacterium]|nr:hypothetical protein [Flavobacteriales bacterium]